MKKISFILVAILVVFVMTGCADVLSIEQCQIPKVYGFWNGLWHGMVLPFSFIGQLFSDNIAIYGMNNNGGWYDFGFVWGASIAFGGGTKVVSKM